MSEINPHDATLGAGNAVPLGLELVSRMYDSAVWHLYRITGKTMPRNADRQAVCQLSEGACESYCACNSRSAQSEKG